MSALPGDPADRRPFPPFAPALSRPTGSPEAAPAAGAPLPPFAPFARPAAAQPAPAPAAAETAGVVDEYARTPEPPEAVQEEAAPFTPAVIEAQDEAWMPWETPDDAGTTRAGEPAREDAEEDLPWLSAEPGVEAAPAPQEPDAGEVPGWMTWSDEEVAPASEPATMSEPEAEAAAEPAAGEAYSFDVEAFDPAPLETPVPEEAAFDEPAFDEAPSALADGEPAALGEDAPFSFAAEPESIAGEPLLYASGEMEPLDAADAFPEAREELAAEEYAPPVHVSEAEAAPEAWSADFAVEEPAPEGVAYTQEPAPDETTAGMEDFYAAGENTAAEEALYAAPAADAEYAGGFDAAGFTEPAADFTEPGAGFTGPAADDYATGYAESAPEAESGFEAPEAESAFAGTGAAALAGGAADALAEVAERLEGIARRLREQPGEVLAGGAGTDPLELLVTGFALGYAQGRRAE